MNFNKIKYKVKKCPHYPIILKAETGSGQSHYFNHKEMSIFKYKIVYGLPIVISIWDNTERRSVFMMNYSEKPMIKIITFIKLAAIMHYAYMMMQEKKP